MSSVRRHLKGAADINQIDANGWTCLHHAASGKHEAIVKMLLDHRADVERSDSLGETALDKAIWAGGENQVLEMLCAAGASANHADENRWCPLHKCAMQHNRKMVKTLLDHGAELESVDELGLTPLCRAVLNRSQPVVDALLEARASVEHTDNQGRSLMELAEGRSRVIWFALEKEMLLNRPRALEQIAKPEGTHSDSAGLRKQLVRWRSYADSDRLLDIFTEGLPDGMDPAEVGEFISTLEMDTNEYTKKRLQRCFVAVALGIDVLKIEGDPEHRQIISYKDTYDEQPTVWTIGFQEMKGRWVFAAPVPWRDSVWFQ